MKLNIFLTAACATLFTFGCQTNNFTNTKRSSEEQLLCTTAVDLALSKVEFPQVIDKKVYIESKRLDSVDKEYVQGALRRKVAMSGAMLCDEKSAADIVLEVFSGCVGTSKTSWLVGVPNFSIAIPLAGTVSIPEIAVMKREREGGTGKIGMIMLSNKTHKSILDIPLLYGDSYYNTFVILFVPFTTTNAIR
ncbi:hypothetical protein P0136_08195 [Lentisphaerota bacterium ZTH]|nr:hypothetical protein JYG24_00695 [Lentisphaerota bacterium]WET05344.1 hypothetical protein P0136_08195 [Lentisphaerota bacterium ZTH]